MLITALGAVALGFVWGWLVAMRDIRRGVLVAAIAVVAGTMLLALQVWMFTAPMNSLFFVASSAIAALLNVMWRADLRRRYGVTA